MMDSLIDKFGRDKARELVDNHIDKNIIHKGKVQSFILKLSHKLKLRGRIHDKSKAESPELEIFAEVTPKLEKLTYGSKEYEESLDYMGNALKHHYEVNRHHPEHFENGLDDMNLVDIIEMLSDWRAAVERHEDGNIYDSLEYNKKRFNMSEQLYNILVNTVRDVFGEEKKKFDLLEMLREDFPDYEISIDFEELRGKGTIYVDDEELKLNIDKSDKLGDIADEEYLKNLYKLIKSNIKLRMEGK